MAKRRQSPLSARSILRRQWKHMLSRCYNENDPSYPKYGARGVSVCERWKDFENFVSDVSPRPEGRTLDRYPDGAGNYEPGNWRWATAYEQTVNRSITRWIEFRGERLCMKDWARRFGLQYSTLKTRLRKGYSLELALTMPASLANGTKFRQMKHQKLSGEQS